MYLSVTDVAHLYVSHLTDGNGLYIDATLGNGYDTLFLAQRLGEKGKIFAFDIAPQAFLKSKELLEKHQINRTNITFIRDSHENIASYIKEEMITAAMFNLGYLPGSGQKYKTEAAVTLQALDAVLCNLQQGGIVTICSYVGHDNGEEDAALQQFLLNVNNKRYEITKTTAVGRKLSPNVYLIIKTGQRDEKYV